MKFSFVVKVKKSQLRDNMNPARREEFLLISEWQISIPISIN